MKSCSLTGSLKEVKIMDKEIKNEIDKIIREGAKRDEIKKFLEGKLNKIAEEVLKDES